MPSLKAIPNKKSGRLLVAVRDILLKERKFEVWLQMHRPYLFDPDHLEGLNSRIEYLDKRIQRAAERERPKIHQLVIG